MFNVVKSDGRYTVEIEIKEGAPFIHLEVRHWSPSVYRDMLETLEQIKKDLAAGGHEFVGAYNHNQDSRWCKFMDMFSFKIKYTYKGYNVYLTPTKE